MENSVDKYNINNSSFSDIEQYELTSKHYFENTLNNEVIVLKKEETISETDSVRFYNYVGGSDSPLSMSNNNSDDESMSIDESIFSASSRHDYNKMSYNDAEKIIEKYEIFDNKYGNELDILVTYLKGQKNIYIQSKYITQFKLNVITFTSLFITTGIAIFTPMMQNEKWNTWLIVILNAFSAMLISLNNYMKLESAAEMYMHLASQYDKLETSMEIASNKMLFITNETEKKNIVLTKIQELEEKLSELKDGNVILIPSEMIFMFPIIYNVNVFSLIKKIQTHKQSLIARFKNVKNEITYICNKYGSMPPGKREKNRLMYLANAKEIIKKEFGYVKNAYSYIDEIFSRENNHLEIMKTQWFCWYSRGFIVDVNHCNPIVDDYLTFILPKK